MKISGDMIGKYGNRMGNTQRFTKFLLGLLFSRSGVKQKETWIFQGQYKKKKRTYVARKMCATQGLKFLSILGVSQAARFCPFVGLRGCVRFPKTYNDLVRSLYIIETTLATKDLKNCIFKPICIFLRYAV